MELTDTTTPVNRPARRGRGVVVPRQRSTHAQAQVPPTDEPLHELMQPEANVQRIMATGSLWFVGAVASVAVVMGLLLSSGWRPSELPAGPQDLWWVSFIIVVFSIGLIGWSGCPILEVSVPVADRNKSRTMQVGTALFIIGSAAALLSILLGPAS